MQSKSPEKPQRLSQSQKKTTGKRVTKSITTREEEVRDRKPPAGAKIVSRTISTSTEPIENGFLIVKAYSGEYRDKQGDHWFSYDEKYFSKNDPLQVRTDGKELSDLFEG